MRIVLMVVFSDATSAWYTGVGSSASIGAAAAGRFSGVGGDSDGSEAGAEPAVGTDAPSSVQDFCAKTQPLRRFAISDA
jgi:hypothetical protein